MTKRAEKPVLPDNEIIRLYKNGLSQQDISRLHGVDIEKIRAVLRRAGFHTAIYRKMPKEYEEVIYILLRAGISYHRIAAVTDISHHVIRSIAERRPDKTVKKIGKRKVSALTQNETKFLQHYLSGQCFCVLSVYLGLSKKEILNCYALLDENTIQVHQRALRWCLEKEDMQQNTVSSLAKKYGISISTIKAHLNI